MWRFLHDAWWRLVARGNPRSFSDAVICRLLNTGSLAYRLAVSLRNLAYDRGWKAQAKLPCKVISVGNLTVGGSGKTTFVELIAEKLKARGKRVAVLSRGYGGLRRNYWLRWEKDRLLVDGEAGVESGELADEPQLLAERLKGVPILVGARREKTGRLACKHFNSEVLVLDDGFQHRPVKRDCDIVLINARMPLGGWAILPRGPMREPLSALKRAHVVVITKADQSQEKIAAFTERIKSFNPEVVVATAVHEPDQMLEGPAGCAFKLSRLAGLRVGLVSSIGDPEGFELTLRRCGAQVLWHETFPDHHRYGKPDCVALITRVKEDPPDAIVTTSKDWVRLRHLITSQRENLVPVWVLTVRMKIISGEAALDARLAAVDNC